MMKKYKLRWTTVVTHEAMVEAESPDDAFDMAAEGVYFEGEREVDEDYDGDVSCTEVQS